MNKQLNNFEEIISGNQPVLVDFYAEWCMPCRILSPILKDLAADMGDTIRILKIDIDKNPSVAQKYGVFSVPTIFLYQNGKIKWKGSGARPKDELKRIIKSQSKIAS